MVDTRRILSIGLAALLLVAAGAFAVSQAERGQWSGTVAAVHGDELVLAGVSERFRLAGGVTELLSGRPLSARDLAPGSAVTLRIDGREADGRFRVSSATVVPKDRLRLEGSVTGVASDARSLEVLGVRVELGPRTAFSGRGASGLVRSARDLTAGSTAQVDLTVKADGALEASHIRVTGSRGRSGRVVGGRRAGEDQEFRGTVLAVSDSSWTIDDRTVAVTDQTVFLGDPGLGDFVEVRFHLDAGNAVADRIQKEDPADDELEFRGIVEAIGDTTWTISGRVVQVNASTFFRGSPGVGDLVEVRADRAPDGSLTATHIKLEDDENADDEREFRGFVEAIGDASWTIGGRIVLVNAQTAIFGNPQVGDLVEVRADRAPDGTLTATRIKTEDGDEDGDDEREFRGIVSSIGSSSWTIGELVVLVNGATAIEGNPQVGDLVEVRADRAPDGTLTATRIKKEDDDGDGDDEREFRGVVSAIGPSSWTIGDFIVLVNDATVIEGNPQVGDLVEVRADRAPDGTLTATRIQKEDGDDDGGGDDHGGPGGGD
jgi:hypothetical protein